MLPPASRSAVHLRQSGRTRWRRARGGCVRQLHEHRLEVVLHGVARDEEPPPSSRVSRPSSRSATSSRSRGVRPEARETRVSTSSIPAARTVAAKPARAPSRREASTSAQRPLPVRARTRAARATSSPRSMRDQPPDDVPDETRNPVGERDPGRVERLEPGARRLGRTARLEVLAERAGRPSRRPERPQRPCPPSAPTAPRRRPRASTRRELAHELGVL